MSSYSFQGFPEVFASTVEQKALVASGLKDGSLRRLRRGLYTTNTVDALEDVVKRNLWPIVAMIVPQCVVSHRTAFEGRPTPGGLVVVTGPYSRTIELPGLKIRQMKGPAALPGDAPFIGGLSMSSRPRFLLECLSGKAYGEDSVFLSIETVEEYLERFLVRGESFLNEIRDGAKLIGTTLGMDPEVTRLEGIIGTLLGTRKSKLVSKTGIARTQGYPYDARRFELFQTLFEEMNAWPETSRPDMERTGEAFRNISFYDAYFSNFIEGTEFHVEEAMEIAFENKIPKARPQDAHDVLGTYRVVSNPSNMQTVVSSLEFDEFISLLGGWHMSIMQGRPEKRPGQFKDVANQAGHTLFVHPDLVLGTLKHGFELCRAIRTPVGRSAYLLFLISEVHPYDDGNGRLARAIANAELVSQGERRLIIPTVFRVEYIDALRLLSREGKARTFARMVDQAQEFCADIDFRDLNVARTRLDAWHAFDDDSEARLRRPRD